MEEAREDLEHDGEFENLKPEAKLAPPATSHTTSLPYFSVSIWPPSQRTRDAVIKRLIENLSIPSSVLSKHYGAVPIEEASAVARLIEQEAFDLSSASVLSPKEGEIVSAEASVDEGLEILQIYSKEISRRMIGSVKARGSSSFPDPAKVSTPPAGVVSVDTEDSAPKLTESATEEVKIGEPEVSSI